MPDTKKTSKSGKAAGTRGGTKNKMEQPAAKAEYLEKLKKQLDEWKGDIAAIDAKAHEFGEDTKARLAALKRQYDEGRNQLEKVAGETGDRWRDFAGDVEQTWKAARNSVNYFRSHFREPSKPTTAPSKAKPRTKRTKPGTGASPKKPA